MTSADSFIRQAAVVFAVGYSLHVFDHFRRGLGTAPPRVIVVGTIQGLLVVVAIATVLKGHRRAPLAAMLAGFGSALVFTFGHLIPGVSADSYVSAPDPSVTWFSWLTAISEIGTGLVLGVAGVRSPQAHSPR